MARVTSGAPDALLARALVLALDDAALALLAERLKPILTPDSIDPGEPTADQSEAVEPSTSGLRPVGTDDDLLLTAGEVAEILRCSTRYVWRLGREGALPRVKHPGRKYVLYPRSGVIAYRDDGFDRARKSAPDTPAVQRIELSQPPRQIRRRRRF